MDITIEQKSPNLFRKYWYVPVIAAGVLGAMLLRQVLGGVTYVVDDNLLRVADVKRDNFTSVRRSQVAMPRITHGGVVGGQVEVFLQPPAEALMRIMYIMLNHGDE